MGRRGGMRELTSAILARGVILFIYSALAIFSSPVPLHEQRERERVDAPPNLQYPTFLLRAPGRYG